MVRTPERKRMKSVEVKDSLLESRTFWFNVGWALLEIIYLAATSQDMLPLSQEIVGLLLFVHAAGNIVLRRLTESPIDPQ